MNSNINNNKASLIKVRRDKSDLIDFSFDNSDETSCNNILDLFDPLSRSSEEEKDNAKQVDQDKDDKKLNLVTDRKRKDRRFKTKYIPARVNSVSDLKETDKTNNTHRLSYDPSKNQNNKGTTTGNDLTSELGCQAFVGKDERDKNKLKLLRKHQRSSQEIVELTKKLKFFREQFKHDDASSNSGIVYSPTLYSSSSRDMSVKIVIECALSKEPLRFTCSVSTTIEHIISHAVCSMFENLKDNNSMDNYMLKVRGKDEYFKSNLCLADYALVSHCLKFDLDVELSLVRIESVKRSFLRSSSDDFRSKTLLCPDDLLSRTAILKYSDLNYESLNIIIDTFERETQRLYSDVTNRATTLQTQSLLQTTKAICSLMLNFETSQLTESTNNLAELCNSYKNEGKTLQDEDRYKMIEVIQHAITRLLKQMHKLLKLTSKSLPVDYEVANLIEEQQIKKSFVDTPVNLHKDSLSFKIQLISQLRPDWITKYYEFFMEVKLMHGQNLLCPIAKTSIIRLDSSFFSRLCFDEELNLYFPYSNLPRESRLVLILYGIEPQPATTANSNQLVVKEELKPIRRSGSSISICSTAPMYTSSPRGSQLNLSFKQNNESAPRSLAVSVSYIFDQELNLTQGDKLLNMCPLAEDEILEDICLETVPDRNNPILVIEFKTFPLEKRIYFPSVDSNHDGQTRKLATKKFEDLDGGLKHIIGQIIDEKQSHERLMDDEKLLLWDNRMFLTKNPIALPKVLLSAPSWSVSHLQEIYELLDCWTKLEAVDAIQLLLPSYPDLRVRSMAVGWISKQNDDELCDFLPQLLQAFRFEKTLDCSLFWMLMERSLKNIRIANLLYWQLKLNSNDPLFRERSETMINCLLHCCGQAFWKSIDKQEELLHQLNKISNDIKKVRDGQRMSLLHKKLEVVQDFLAEKKPTMPWAPSLEVCDIEIRSCSYFPSNTLPLKLAFRSCEESCNNAIKFHTYDAIFKTGDDLRQDMIAIQMIRIMEKLWLREGLDFRMVTFDCLATNDRQGLVEMVQNAETLRKIHQNKSFITGPFNPKAIDSYIRLWNTSELEYKTALDKFLHSCAGYSVATYILGICDRHNDNIMISNSGHLFHIDFGKFLGDAQMMGSIKRDRTPFVLTADMAYVINGGDRPSKKFQTFVELCTMGFNIIRRHRNLFLNLFSLMTSAKIHGLNSESLKYVDRMLMPELTESEAMAKFTTLINECLSSRSTQVNFFIHNLAQLRFTNDLPKQSLFSFIPKTFTLDNDGKIESLEIVDLFKRYEPEKQYYYVVRVKRQNQPGVTDIIRTFREFSELQMRLSCSYPCNHFNDIGKSTNSFLMDIVGRNNTREIAERRLVELRIFIARLLQSPREISESDLIYTFFHPILRDQATSFNDSSFLNQSSSSTFGSQEYSEAQRNALYLGSNGQIKLSITYKNSSLSIMVMHAKNLPCIEGSIGPNCYAKTYLQPDPYKQTKRKTRVVRQSCHPTFMELIVYKEISMETLRKLTLQVSVWHSEIVQQKFFMGGALIKLEKLDLSKEVTSWYPLKNF